MPVIHATRILKDMPNVLSWNDDIYMIHYVQPQECEKVNVLIEMNLISLVLHGRKEIYHPSGKTTIKAGSGFFMKKGAYLMTERLARAQQEYEAVTILFSDKWLQSEAGRMFAQQLPLLRDKTAAGSVNPIVQLAEDDLLRELSSQLRSYFTGTANRERLQSLLPIKIRELFQVLMSAPGGHSFGAQLQDISTGFVPDLVQLMEAHFKEQLSLEQYAFLAHCSLSTFKRKFEQVFQMPPGKWIQQRRLEEAYRLLGKAGRNITEIAYEAGFESPAHFISSFKEQYGITPKQLQQQLPLVPSA